MQPNIQKNVTYLGILSHVQYLLLYKSVGESFHPAPSKKSDK